MPVTCTCASKVLAVPTPCPVHWPDGVVKLMEAAAAKANAKGVPMLTGEQFKVIEALSGSLPVPTEATDYRMGWLNGIVVLLDAIRSNLVMKVEVSPTATASGTIEGLDGLGRRGQG